MAGDNFDALRKAPKFLTVVYRVAPGDDARAILEARPWSVASWSHATDERDALRAERDALAAEVQEQARCNGMGSEREARLMAERDELRRERDALQAKVEAMEKAIDGLDDCRTTTEVLDPDSGRTGTFCTGCSAEDGYRPYRADCPWLALDAARAALAQPTGEKP